MLGLLAAWYADRCRLDFDTRAVWWAQALKLVLGLALVMGVRVGLKAALAALFGEAPFAVRRALPVHRACGRRAVAHDLRLLEPAWPEAGQPAARIRPLFGACPLQSSLQAI